MERRSLMRQRDEPVDTRGSEGRSSVIVPDSHPGLSLQPSCVDGYVNVQVSRCAVQVGVNVDVQSVQESLTELTAVCESWYGDS
ncbi:hypothetical protein PAMP_008718 [Pampus punctatissimus]